MNDSLVDSYRRWFEYEKDSHAKTLDSLNSVAGESRQAEGFRKAVYLMGHIIAARRMWLSRFGVLHGSIELFPQEATVGELPAQLLEIEKLWSEYLSQLKDPDLARVFELSMMHRMIGKVGFE